jgi:hypothetical protein
LIENIVKSDGESSKVMLWCLALRRVVIKVLCSLPGAGNLTFLSLKQADGKAWLCTRETSLDQEISVNKVKLQGVSHLLGLGLPPEKNMLL